MLKILILLMLLPFILLALAIFMNIVMQGIAHVLEGVSNFFGWSK